MAENRGRYLSLLFAVLAGIVYLGTVTFQFVYDDVGQIVDNPSIRSWRFVPQYFTSHIWASVLDFSAYYRPLDLLWFRLNYFLFGLNAGGWHVASILAHAVATFLVFRLVVRLLEDERVALLSALVFGLHPIHVQSVAWVSGVADPLLTIFVIGSLICYLNFNETKRIGWLCWSLLLYTCAVLTKETGIIVPVLIVVQEWLNPTGNRSTRGFAPKVRHAVFAVMPFLGVSAAYLSVRFRSVGAFAPSASGMSFAEMIFTWPAVLWLYTKHLFAPWGYSLYYDVSLARHTLSREFLIPLGWLVLTLAVAGALALWLKVDREVLAVSAVWFVVPMLPSLLLTAIKPEIFGQDRYLYLSCLGFAIFLSSVTIRVSELRLFDLERRSTLRYAAALFGVVFASCTLIQQQYWVSNIALFHRALTIAPNNADAIENLGVALSENNQFKLAIPLLGRALERDHNSARLNYNYGYALYGMGDYEHALPQLARAIQLNPRMGEAFLYIGMCHLKLGFARDAALEIREALALEPDRRGVHLALGVVLEAEGDLAGAIAETQIEANTFPDDPLIHQRLLALEQRSN